MRAVVASLWALSLVLPSCGSAPAAAPVEPTPPSKQVTIPDAAPEPEVSPSPPDTDPASQPEAASQDEDTEPSEEENMLGIVRDNVAVTDLSALARITSSRVEGSNGAPPATTGYVNHVYEVEILTPISGCGARRSFTFSQMAEADIRPMKDGTVLFVSVCRSGKGSYYTPDVGYAIPQSALPASALKELMKKPLKKSASACGE